MSKKIAACLSSKSVEWATPQAFFNKLNEEFQFDLDPCSTHENAKCVKHYTIEGDCWEFDDKDDQPKGIPLTKEILDDNGFRYENDYGSFYRSIIGSHHYTSPMCVCVEWRETSEGRKICYIDCVKRENGKESSVIIRREFYVHTLQHALRLCGLNELSDNFKV